MKSVTKLFSIFFLAILSNFTANAQGTITWALTANGNASTVTGLTTYPVAVGTELTSPLTSSNYSASGVTANGWGSSSAGMLNNEYYEY